MPLPEPSTPSGGSPSLLRSVHHAALLAGLGPRAHQVTAELDAGAVGGVHTCVDAGASVLLAVAAPAPRGLRLLVRQPPQEPGVAHWRRLEMSSDGTERRGTSEALEVAGTAAWERALRLARGAGAEERLKRLHTLLGGRGRLFTLQRREATPTEPEEAWVSWHLDRRSPPHQTLAACGEGWAWRPAADLLRQLLGRPVLPRGRSWNLAWELRGEAPRLRLGTTFWALCPENRDKRRRLAEVTRLLGGDPRFAEGLHGLLAKGGRRRVGRSVEIELCGGEVVGFEAYLAPPAEPPAPSRRPATDAAVLAREPLPILESASP